LRPVRHDRVRQDGEVLDQASATAGPAIPEWGRGGRRRRHAQSGRPYWIPEQRCDWKRRREREERLVYRVTLRMDDGSFRAISLSSPPSSLSGEKVQWSRAASYVHENSGIRNSSGK